MLTFLLIIPLIGSLIILFQPGYLPRPDASSTYKSEIDYYSEIIEFLNTKFEMFSSENEEKKNKKMKQIALTTSLINLFLSLYLWFQFDSNLNDFQFVTEFYQWNIFNLNFGVDGLSLYFVLLTTFITPIGLLANYNNITTNLRLFLISVLVLESLQICAFVSLDLLLFYIFFESVLPVLFVYILVFGHGGDRVRSAFLFILYTLTGSLPMLLSILMIYSYVGSTDLQLISLFEISLDYQKILWLGFFIAFAFKTPLYPFIIWLPKAHADSVLAGSIILAATILKLAVYGELRVLINFFPDATHFYLPFVQSIAILTIVYASLSTIVQQDTKRLIAYSSIAHMGVITLGVFSNTIHGIEGAILLSIAHGFVSPALFTCVGGVIMDRAGTRNINYIRGLVTYMPVFTLLFFLFTLANSGVPLSLNWLGETLSLMGIWNINPLAAALGASGILLSACYSLFLYNRLSYGSYSPYLPIYKDLNRREYYLLLSLLIPTFALGIFPNVILDTLHISVSSLIYHTF